uniref:Uncharacterized protein n=1 Tax=Opuntia streptacantha TaxID=393608 RepID=A0A7C9EBR5_OPUST
MGSLGRVRARVSGLGMVGARLLLLFPLLLLLLSASSGPRRQPLTSPGRTAVAGHPARRSPLSLYPSRTGAGQNQGLAAVSLVAFNTAITGRRRRCHRRRLRSPALTWSGMG